MSLSDFIGPCVFRGNMEFKIAPDKEVNSNTREVENFFATPETEYFPPTPEMKDFPSTPEIDYSDTLGLEYSPLSPKTEDSPLTPGTQESAALVRTFAEFITDGRDYHHGSYLCNICEEVFGKKIDTISIMRDSIAFICEGKQEILTGQLIFEFFLHIAPRLISNNFGLPIQISFISKMNMGITFEPTITYVPSIQQIYENDLMISESNEHKISGLYFMQTQEGTAACILHENECLQLNNMRHLKEEEIKVRCDIIRQYFRELLEHEKIVIDETGNENVYFIMQTGVCFTTHPGTEELVAKALLEYLFS